MSSHTSITDRPGFDLWGFLLFSHGWTWLWWSVPILTGWHAFRFPGVVFLIVGGLGVTVGGVAMARLVGGRAGLRDLGTRLVDTGRIAPRWALVMLGLWPALAVAAAGVAVVVDGAADPLSAAPLLDLLGDPAALVVTLAMIFLLGPLHEEIGWRGYWLDRLQMRWSALTASLVLGVAWAAWHVPLFLMVGYFDAWGYAPNFAWYAADLAVVSVLYTWLYNNTRRSLLAAVGFHFARNGTGQLLDLSPAARIYQGVAIVLLVVVVVYGWGPTGLRRGEADESPGAGDPLEAR